MDLAAIIVSAISLFVSVWTAIDARRRDAIAFETQVQGEYEQIRRRMDVRYTDENWVPPVRDASVWGPLEEYWWFCYSEYERTRGHFRSVWEEKLRERVAAGLSHRPLRYVLAGIVARGSMNTGYADGFLAEMRSIYGADFLAELIAEHKLNREIATEMHISPPPSIARP